MKEKMSCLVIPAAFFSAVVSKDKFERFSGRKPDERGVKEPLATHVAS